MEPEGTEHQTVPTFRELVEAGIEFDPYEPQILLLIPVYLRSRRQYYEEAAQRIHRKIEDFWQSQSHWYEFRDEFEKSSLVTWIWDSGSPPWWGLNDVVGYIDVRVCVRKREIQAALFLPKKRISRQLKEKIFWFQRREAISLGERATNERLRSQVMELVHRLRADDRLKNRYVDLEQWQRILNHVDLVGLIKSAAASDRI